MPIAHQEQAQQTCPTCGADFAASVWLILDAQEEPAAVETLLRGELNVARCPSCGASEAAKAPLLFHDALARCVIFAPAPDTAEYTWGDQARELHTRLLGAIPEEQRRPYLADVAVAQDLAGIAHRLRRIAQRHGGAGRAGQGDKGTGRQGDRATRGQGDKGHRDSVAPNDQMSSLQRAVTAMLGADTPGELEQVLAAHPALRSPSIDATLAELAQAAVEQRAYTVADSLREARALLVRMGVVAPPVPPAEPVSERAVTAIPEGSFMALLQAQSGAEVEVVASAHPLLLRPELDRLLAERVELALDEGHERLAHAIEERREVLAHLRQLHPDDPSTLDEAVEALLNVEGELARTEVINRYPILREDVAAQALWQFAAEARASGDEDLARCAIECRKLLRRIRDGLAD